MKQDKWIKVECPECLGEGEVDLPFFGWTKCATCKGKKFLMVQPWTPAEVVSDPPGGGGSDH